MTDRAVELAAAFMTNPWVDRYVQKSCEKLLTKWETEDIMSVEQPDTATEIIAKTDAPQVKCETCRYFDNSSSLIGNETTGQCRIDPPTSHIITGAAVWPYPEADDWCGRHSPCHHPVNNGYFRRQHIDISS